MGYPESHKIIVSDTQAYRQFGNSVVVPVVEMLAKAVRDALKRPAGTPGDLILQESPKVGEAVAEHTRKSVKYPTGRQVKRRK
jgi:hypothetical protein